MPFSIFFALAFWPIPPIIPSNDEPIDNAPPRPPKPLKNPALSAIIFTFNNYKFT